MSAIQRLLRPVVRQLIAYGVSYPAVSQILKQLYVDVAEEDFRLSFKRQTDSRLALVTGINRKDVAQLRRRPEEPEAAVEVEDTVVTHVIGRWMSGPPYAASGRAHAIPYESIETGAPSFTHLVRQLRIDIPARSVLDELLRVGAVELRPDGYVVLKREAHIPPTAAEGKITLLGTDPAELYATIAHNIEHPEDPRLQRKVVYDNIGSDALPALRQAGRALGEEFIRRANATLGACDRDSNPTAPGGKRARVALGVYYFEAIAARPGPPAARDRPTPPGRIKKAK